MALESDRGSRRRGMITACRGARRMVTTQLPRCGRYLDFDCMRPAVLRRMEERIAACQSDVTSAGAVNVTSFAAGHKGLGGDLASKAV